MKISTPYGDEDVSPGKFPACLDGLQRSAISNDEDCFIVVEGRRPNLFLQAMPWKLERLEDGRIYRATFPPAVHEMFLAFAEGERGWDEGIEWIDVTDGPPPRARNWTGFFVMLAIVIAAVGFAAVRIFGLLPG